MEKKKGERKDFGWRYQPLRSSARGILLDYLDNPQQHPDGEKTKMILRALTAYYLPLAYLAREHSRSEVEPIGWDCVFALLRQVDYLCLHLGLDRKQVGGLVPNGIAPGLRTSPSRSAKKSAASEDDSFNLEGLSSFSVSYRDEEEASD
ncbi:MAG: hypothetical protein ACRDEA_03905 [Microcystaceae cyanobacterium]